MSSHPLKAPWHGTQRERSSCARIENSRLLLRRHRTEVLGWPVQDWHRQPAHRNCSCARHPRMSGFAVVSNTGCATGSVPAGLSAKPYPVKPSATLFGIEPRELGAGGAGRGARSQKEISPLSSRRKGRESTVQKETAPGTSQSRLFGLSFSVQPDI